MVEGQIIGSQEVEIDSIKYKTLFNQVESLTSDEPNLIANLSNISALLMDALEEHWIGFYLIDQDSNELVLGPFQGPLACTRISFGRGVCGTAWETKLTQRIADVHKFPGHIACSAESNSEIVIPIIKNQSVVAVLDIDSIDFDKFSESDQEGLEAIAQLISKLF